MVSLRGVEPPLAGGPHEGVIPSWAWISRALSHSSRVSLTQRDTIEISHRFRNSLPPSSCDGDPAPNLALPVAVAILLILTLLLKGDRMVLPDGGSIGDVFSVDDPDRG